ncbi:MAG: hypothetical protein M1812_000377 [Candelaria pacifica]|nr:MAG: hypothetical protein M1812_000377 [Candelaria pacifica]
MARKSRAAAQAATVSIKSPTPDNAQPSDEDLADAAASGTSTPQGEEADAEEEVGTPAQASEPPSEPSTPAPAQPAVPRKRRLGRPPKIKPPGWDDMEPAQDGASEGGTPQKKRRGRPPAAGGGRWPKARGGPSHVTQVPIDKEGNMMDVIDDEVAIGEDPEGETKVDKDGNLKGGREYRVRTFTILGRGNRLYMLSTEPARCIGFRDSYLFFTKHKQLYKIIIDEAAKRDLIDRSIIPHSYKGRAIGVVTARSVFREFGASIIIAGKKVVDEYHEQAARERGEVEGELAVPDDEMPKEGESYNRNRYVAWHGASSVYHSGAPSVPFVNGKVVEGKKKKVVVTGINWMFEHAREASRFNSSLAAVRRQNLDGIYDPHTNVMHYPAITQPTHASWEQLPIESTTPGWNGNDVQQKIMATTNGVVDLTQSSNGQFEELPQQTLFTAVNPIYTRNYMLTDTHFVTPPISGLGVPGPNADNIDVGSNGLSDVADDVLAELPAVCRKAFEDARTQELEWKHGWRSEADQAARGKLRIGY